MAAVARAGSRVNHTRIILAWRKAFSAPITADPPVFLGGMNDCLLSGTALAHLITTAPTDTEMPFLAFAKKFLLACSSLYPDAPTDPDMTVALIESLHHFRTANSELEMALGGGGVLGGLFSLDGCGLRVDDGRCTCGSRVPAMSGFCMCGKLIAGAWSCTCRAPRIYASCASLRTALWASFLPRNSPQRPAGTGVISRPSRLLAGAGPAAPAGR